MTRDRDTVFTPQEVAALLRLSIDSVYRHLKTGRLRSYRLGGPTGEYRITADALDEFKWTPEREEE
jgi:excisionase family DNA binding protein